jgi:uncharacterized protein (TIGR04255 family)
MAIEVATGGPFGSEPIEEIGLTHAPLARVLTQVRFPRLARLVTSDEAVNGIAAALADLYPQFDEAREFIITLTADGINQTPASGRVWHLKSADEDWQVSFGAEFLSLHTSAYISREDFVARFSNVVDLFAAHVPVPRCDRVGVRYINRVELHDIKLDELRSLVRSELLGGLAVPLAGVGLATAMNEALYDVSPPTDPTPGLQVELTDGLQARWGLLPAGAQLDVTLQPLAIPSWVLDLDAFRAAPSIFTKDAVSAHTRELAERAYRFFRWAVTEEF